MAHRAIETLLGPATAFEAERYGAAPASVIATDIRRLARPGAARPAQMSQQKMSQTKKQKNRQKTGSDFDDGRAAWSASLTLL